jgi:hypothetical protein
MTATAKRKSVVAAKSSDPEEWIYVPEFIDLLACYSEGETYFLANQHDIITF